MASKRNGSKARPTAVNANGKYRGPKGPDGIDYTCPMDINDPRPMYVYNGPYDDGEPDWMTEEELEVRREENKKAAILLKEMEQGARKRQKEWEIWSTTADGEMVLRDILNDLRDLLK